jgi:polysaccharide pyruvyl transferase WcaK-like protein
MRRGRVIVMPQALGPDPSEDDRAICQAFVERVRARADDPALVQFVNPGTASLSDYLRLLSQVTLLVGTRLHACILAMLAGAPAISIGYQAKSEGTLAMLGLQDLNLDIAEVSTDRLVSAMERVLADREALVARIAEQAEAAAARIDRDVGSLLRSLHDGSGRPAGNEARAVGQGRT